MSVRSGQPFLPCVLAPNRLQLLLMVAGDSCCTAMAMPQVHIVAYCADLGFGSEWRRMLSLMLGAGIVSRFLRLDRGPDRAVAGLLLSSSLQAASLLLYFWANGLTSLYVVAPFSAWCRAVSS